MKNFDLKEMMAMNASDSFVLFVFAPWLKASKSVPLCSLRRVAPDILIDWIREASD